MRAAWLCLVLPIFANGRDTTATVARHQHRQLPGMATCTDNPRDMIVTMDLQLEYPIEEQLEVCSDAEEGVIIETISTALNAGFDRTVPNWKGAVTFGPFHFDYDQEEVTQRAFDDETCPERTEECEGKFCRWGCLSVEVTDCGTSDWNRWDNLEQTVEAALIDLKYECLGLADKLTVKMVVPGDDEDIPGFANVTAAADDGKPPQLPGQQDGNSTDRVVEEEDMEEDQPSVEDEEEEEDEDDEETPGQGGDKEVNPPKGSKEEEGGDASSTRSGGFGDDGDDEDVTKSTSKSSGKSSTTSAATNKYAADGSCASNAVEYPVSVDLQITGATAACSADETTNMNAAIESELNGAFHTTVPDWDGQVSFGEVSFAGARRQLAALRGAHKAVQRQLASCSGRTIECTADSCLWGCVVATSTDCGTSSLTNWANLAENVQAAVSGLGYACLGSDVQANIVVDDPEGKGDLPVVAEKEKSMVEVAEEVVEQESTAQGFDAILASFAEDETVTDAPSRGLQIKSEFIFTFFEGTGRMPTEEEIKLADVASIAYFKQQFRANADFGSVFQTMTISEPVPKYNPNNPDEFILRCLITVAVNENAPVSAQEAAQIIADSDFPALIDQYLRVTSESQFFETFKVFFKGSTHASG